MDCAGLPQPRLLVDGGSVGRRLDCGLCLQFYGNSGKKLRATKINFFSAASGVAGGAGGGPSSDTHVIRGRQRRSHTEP